MKKNWWKQSVWVMAAVMAMTFFVAGCAQDKVALPEAISAATATAPAGENLTIRMLDIGQGDSLLIKTPQQVILIDTGDVEMRAKIIALLKQENISTIDQLIITHPHADHLGGAYAVLNNFTVKKIYDNGQPASTATYRTYLKLIKNKKIAYQQLLAGTTLDFGGGVRFDVLSPTAEDIKKNDDLNENSIVGKLVYGEFSLLFTGDSEVETEKKLLQTYGAELKSTVLKSPHHGSKTSSNRNYLKAVGAEAVLISVGLDNDYKHPHAVTLNKYKDVKLDIYRTDQSGMITVQTDGKTYKIVKEK